MRRELGTFETAATLTNERYSFVVVVVVRLAAAGSPERLRRALDALQRRHPPLAVRIVEHGGRFRYEPEGTPRIPLRVVERAGEEHWREVTERELDGRIDAARGPLVRCTFLAPSEPSGDTAAEILLSFHHAVMDAASGTALVGELLDLWTSTEPRGEPEAFRVRSRARSLPPVEELFPRSYRGARGAVRSAGFLARQMADEAVYRFRTRGARPAPAAESAGCRILPVRLSRVETSALVRATRRRRVTLNAALGAAFLLAVHRHLPEARSDRARSRPMRYMTFADLRPYLKPPVGDDALGGYLAMMRYTTRVDGGSGDSAEAFWGLARRITDQVAAGSRRGDKLWSVLFSEKVMRMMLGQRAERMAHTAVSYSGVTRLDAEGVRGLHAFVSNLPVGPEYTALARMFEGELLLDVLYLDTDMDAPRARTLADEILATLRGAGTE